MTKDQNIRLSGKFEEIMKELERLKEEEKMARLDKEVNDPKLDYETSGKLLKIREEMWDHRFDSMIDRLKRAAEGLHPLKEGELLHIAQEFDEENWKGYIDEELDDFKCELEDRLHFLAVLKWNLDIAYYKLGEEKRSRLEAEREEETETLEYRGMSRSDFLAGA